MNYSPPTIELMRRAILLGSCWCSDRAWYAQLDPVKCTMCRAREAMAKEEEEAIRAG
jgi:hypothetical protein